MTLTPIERAEFEVNRGTANTTIREGHVIGADGNTYCGADWDYEDLEIDAIGNDQGLWHDIGYICKKCKAVYAGFYALLFDHPTYEDDDPCVFCMNEGEYVDNCECLPDCTCELAEAETCECADGCVRGLDFSCGVEDCTLPGCQERCPCCEGDCECDLAEAGTCPCHDGNDCQCGLEEWEWSHADDCPVNPAVINQPTPYADLSTT